MSKRDYWIMFLVASCVSAALTSPSAADWPHQGTPVSVAASDQITPVILDMGDGEVIIAWIDRRNDSGDIYAQRLNSYGVPLWTENGVPVCTQDSLQLSVGIVSDGAGGAILAWDDNRSGEWDIYAQRIDGDGTPLWTADGVVVSQADSTQMSPVIAADAAGGAIIAWRDTRADTTDIYAQRVDESGVPLWTADGESVCIAPGYQFEPEIAPDGAGGAIIVWNDYRNGSFSDLYAQRVDADGNMLWTHNGEPLAIESGSQYKTSIAPDGEGGAVFAWEDSRGARSLIYGQKFDDTGTALWTVNGIALGSVIAGDDSTQMNPVALPDGEGGAFVFWQDFWEDILPDDHYDIYGQRVSAAGALSWLEGSRFGKAIATGAFDKSYPAVVEDGLGGVIITWQDERDMNFDVYVQRVDELGLIKWEAQGVPLCTAGGNQSGAVIVSDGVGGAIVAWHDDRGGAYDIYAQRVTRQGHWGYPAPAITSVSDIPADQGGQVWLTFDASRLDVWQNPQIIQYSVWRNIPLTQAAMMAGGVVLSSPADATPDMTGKAVYMTQEAAWELVAGTSALQFPEYAVSIKTLRDSTSADPATEYYFVTAAGFGLADHWESQVVSGYSVDNLAPCAPSAVSAQYISEDLWMHWNPNPEDDLLHYFIYRGASESFVPSEANRIGCVTDTSYVDNTTGGLEHYYKISAVDVHENESPFSLLTPDMVAGTPPGSGPTYDNVLFQNSPNPFSRSTKIVFSLESAAHVRLEVFDAMGRLVRTVVNEVRSPMVYTESWDGRDNSGRRLAAGTYFYRLEIPGWKEVRKMSLVK